MYVSRILFSSNFAAETDLELAPDLLQAWRPSDRLENEPTRSFSEFQVLLWGRRSYQQEWTAISLGSTGSSAAAGGELCK